MQLIYKNEDKDIVVEEQIQWVLLYIREINRYLKEKCSGGFEDRKLKIRDSWEILADLKKEFERGDER